MYTMTGRLPGSRTTRAITWDDGDLRGDGLLVALVRLESELWEGLPVGPPSGPYTLHDHVGSGLSTVVLIASILDQTTLSIAGSRPERPDVPEGAIS